MTLRQYFGQLKRLIESEDGNSASRLLAYNETTFRVLVPLSKRDDPERAATQELSHPWIEIGVNFLKCLQSLEKGDYVEAFACHVEVVDAFSSAFEALDSWCLPILGMFLRALREIAVKADQELAGRRQKADKLGECARLLQRFFGQAIRDHRSAEEGSRKLGCLDIINNQFKVIFQQNNLQMCSHLIRTVEHTTSFPKFHFFPTAQRVTYKFFTGKLALFETEFQRAEECLQYAFDHCHKDHTKNKQRILLFLATVKLARGKFPKPSLLEKYGLPQFQGIMSAIKSGNMRLFNESMKQHEKFFIAQRVYLVLEKTKIIAFRNLVRRIYLLEGSSTRLNLQTIVSTLAFLGESMDIDEVECILVNLIYQGYIKGYISHEKKILVMSKTSAFPKLSTIHN